MSPLVVEVDGRVLRLEGGSVVRIGRAIEADVVLTAGSVSRQHAELRPLDDGWLLVDTGSQFGTFVDGKRIGEHTIRGRTVVTCGPDTPGAALTVMPADQAPPDLPGHTPGAPPPPLEPSLEQPTMPPPPRGASPAGPQETGEESSRFAPPPEPGPPMPPPQVGERPTAPGPPTPAPTPGPPVPQPPSAEPPSAEPPSAEPPSAEPPGAQPSASVPPPPAPGPAQRPSAATPPEIPPGLDQTQVLAAQSAPAGGGAAPPRSGPDLLLVAEGREHRFRHPAEISIGRRTECTVVLSDPAASRMHGQVSATRGGWVYTNHSNEGTYLDGRRLTTRHFDEKVVLRLGHPVAGPEVTLVPILSAAEEEKRFARRRVGRRLLILGIVAAVVLLIGGIVGATVLLSRDDDEGDGNGGAAADPSSESTDASTSGDASASPDDLTDAELGAAKAATVKIIGQSHFLEDPDGRTFVYAGSGSIIRSDGLILTNAHVAAPESPGIVEQYGDDAAIADPEYLLISLTDGMTDTNAPPEYRAELVVADGELDVAVIRIVANADGSELDGELDLPTVPIGTSEDVRAGDDVTVLGFPAVAGSGDSISVTTGVISTVINDPDLGPRSEFDTDARISGGNSGGMAVDNEGALIGLPTAVQFDPSGTPVTSGRIRSIDVVKDLIEEAEAKVG